MKTAIEWLISQLNKESFAQVVTDEEIAQALAMEKEQIDDAYDSGWYDGSQEDPENRMYKDYYQETFKSEDQ